MVHLGSLQQHGVQSGVGDEAERVRLELLLGLLAKVKCGVRLDLSLLEADGLYPVGSVDPSKSQIPFLLMRNLRLREM